MEQDLMRARIAEIRALRAGITIASSWPDRRRHPLRRRRPR
jgi:hypothetical protein